MCLKLLLLAVFLALSSVRTGAGATCTAGNPSANVSELTPTSAFVDNRNGTITHTLTGLMWKQCAEGLTSTTTACDTGTATTATWSVALTAAKSSSFAGYTDWRLPNLKELESIVETCGYDPAINQTIFPATSASVFWTSSSWAPNPPYAWNVTFFDGPNGVDYKIVAYYVRLVRGGQSFDAQGAKLTQTLVFGAAPSVVVNGTGAVQASDTVTSPTDTGAISYSTTSSACSVTSAGVVTGLAAGTNNCPITASQAADANYWAATASQTLSIGKGNQTITITSSAPANAVVGGATYAVTATGGASGNAVTFAIAASSGTVCTLNASTVSFIGAGTCTIIANQAGNASYLAAVAVQQSFSVAPRCIVNGGISQTLQAAVDAAAPGGIVTVAGKCSENVLVKNEKMRLTIDGGASAVLAGPSTASATLTVRGKGILVQNFSYITGGSHGIEIQRGSSATLNHNTVQGTGGDGIVVRELAFATITNSNVQSNPGNGIAVTQGGIANIGFNFVDDTVASPNSIQNNGGRGVLVTERSSAWISGNTIAGNGDDGIAVLRESHATLAGNAIDNNGQSYTGNGSGGSGVNVADKGSAYLGGETNLPPFLRAANTTVAPNHHFGLRCGKGGEISGHLGGTSQLAGVVSQFGGGGANAFDTSCKSSLVTP